MDTQTTGNRTGIVDEINLIFKVTAQFNGDNVCGAEGVLMHPQGLHEEFRGTHKLLFDKGTNVEYEIFVSDERFSFSSYKKVKKLFK